MVLCLAESSLAVPILSLEKQKTFVKGIVFYVWNSKKEVIYSNTGMHVIHVLLLLFCCCFGGVGVGGGGAFVIAEPFC